MCGDIAGPWGAGGPSGEGPQRTPTVPSVCARPSSTRARRPLGPCTPPASRGECGRVRDERGAKAGSEVAAGWCGRGCRRAPLPRPPLHTPRATRLFCDVYNPQSKTYCKRLQVLCPEHSRDPKVRLSHPRSLPPPMLTPSFLMQPFFAFLPSLCLHLPSRSFPLLRTCHFPHPPRDPHRCQPTRYAGAPS